MNEDELLEFNYRNVRKRETIKFTRIFSVYDSAETLYFDQSELDKASVVKPYIKNGRTEGTMITIEDYSYYVQENYAYVASFIFKK